MAKKAAFPPELLDDVPWSFAVPAPADRAGFVAEVRAYLDDIGEGDEIPWRPDEVVLRAARVRVVADDGELVADLDADGPVGFTAGELLFKIHGAFAAQLSEGDHHFFEGLVLTHGRNPNAPPVYEVLTGS